MTLILMLLVFRDPKNKSGFTIVELLVVVVVIGVLAAIAAAGFSGVQARANDSKIISVVSSYQKILELYKIDNGRYPQDYNWVCLGESAHYPEKAPYVAGQCNTSSNNVWSSGLADELRPFVSNGLLPDPTFASRSAAANGVSRGVIYDSTSAHVSGGATLTYYLVGQRDCPIGIFREYRDSLRVTVCNQVLKH